MAPSRTDLRRWASLVLGCLLLAGCGGGAAADPEAPPPAAQPTEAQPTEAQPTEAQPTEGPTDAIAADGVGPGSGEVTPEGHRETDTDLDTWVAPDITAGGWYAFPLPSGFAADPPPDGVELLIRSNGQATTALTVTRLPQEAPLSLQLADASVEAAGRQPLGDARWRDVGGLQAVVVDALDTAAEPVMTVRQVLLDVGTDRLVLAIATDADPAEAELGLIDAVVLDNLRTEVLE